MGKDPGKPFADYIFDNDFEKKRQALGSRVIKCLDEAWRKLQFIALFCWLREGRSESGCLARDQNLPWSQACSQGGPWERGRLPRSNIALIFIYWLVSSTHILQGILSSWNKEKLCSGQRKFSHPRRESNCNLLNSRSDVLTTEPPGL